MTTDQDSCDLNVSAHLSSEEIDNLFQIDGTLLTVCTVIVTGIFCVGFICNSAFLIVLLRVQEMKTVVNFYLGNLAVADLSFVTIYFIQFVWFSVPSAVEFIVTYRSSFGCFIPSLLLLLTGFASVSFVTLVTVERFFAICLPLKHRQMQYGQKSVKIAVITWIVGVVVAVLDTLFISANLKISCSEWLDGKKLTVPMKIYTCVGLRKWGMPVIQFLVTGLVCSMFLINLITTIKIILKLHRRSVLFTKKNKQENSSQSDTTKVRDHVAKMLITNNVIFFSLYIIVLISLMLRFAELNLGYRVIGKTAMKYLQIIGSFCLMLNSSVNPIIYNVVNPRYRKAFKQTFVLGCYNGRKKPEPSTDVTNRLELERNI